MFDHEIYFFGWNCFVIDGWPKQCPDADRRWQFFWDAGFNAAKQWKENGQTTLMPKYPLTAA